MDDEGLLTIVFGKQFWPNAGRAGFVSSSTHPRIPNPHGGTMSLALLRTYPDRHELGVLMPRGPAVPATCGSRNPHRDDLEHRPLRIRRKPDRDNFKSISKFLGRASASSTPADRPSSRSHGQICSESHRLPRMRRPAGRRPFAGTETLGAAPDRITRCIGKSAGMISALRETMPSSIHCQTRGGLYIGLTCPETTDTDALCQEAARPRRLNSGKQVLSFVRDPA
jgi:hypothetical protein